jgi:hypothetical protein
VDKRARILTAPIQGRAGEENRLIVRVSFPPERVEKVNTIMISTDALNICEPLKGQNPLAFPKARRTGVGNVL